MSDWLTDTTWCFKDDTGDFEVWIDDCDKVCSAFLRHHDEVVGDVWLFNRGETPPEPEWRDKNNIPFKNSLEFAFPALVYKLPQGADDCSVEWSRHLGKVIATISFHDRVVAILMEGELPGWSAMARRDGPLAKRIDNWNDLKSTA